MTRDDANQSVSNTAGAHAAGVLLRDAAPTLAGWYADPLPPAAARRLLERSRQALRACLCAGRSPFRLHVLALLCHGWLAHDTAAEYRRLAALANDVRDRALLELAYGQLLISRKLESAPAHLARGLQLAAPLLDNRDYFAILRRHERLDGLLLAATPADAPLSLPALLNEAAVIALLRGRTRRGGTGTHRDTVG